MEKYVFAKNINDTHVSGIVDVEKSTILCYCNEDDSKVILPALKIYSNVPVSGNEAKCPHVDRDKNDVCTDCGDKAIRLGSEVAVFCDCGKPLSGQPDRCNDCWNEYSKKIKQKTDR